MKKIDFNKLSKAQITEIERVAEVGVSANAFSESSAGRTARLARKSLAAATAELEILKKTNDRRNAVEAAGLEWLGSEDYFMGFSDEHFLMTVEKLSHAMVATAEVKPNVMRIPQLHSCTPLEGFDLVKSELQNRKNGG